MTEPSTTSELVALLRAMPEPGAARDVRAAWLSEKARVLRRIAAEYDEQAAVALYPDWLRREAAKARELADEADRTAAGERGESA